MVDFRREDLLAELDRGVILTSEILDRRQPIQGLGPVVVLLRQLPRLRRGRLDPLRGLALGDEPVDGLELRLVLRPRSENQRLQRPSMAALNCSGSVVRPRTSTSLRSSARRRRAVPDDFGRGGPSSASLERVISASFSSDARAASSTTRLSSSVSARSGVGPQRGLLWQEGAGARGHAAKKKSWRTIVRAAYTSLGHQSSLLSE